MAEEREAEAEADGKVEKEKEQGAVAMKEEKKHVSGNGKKDVMTLRQRSLVKQQNAKGSERMNENLLSSATLGIGWLLYHKANKTLVWWESYQKKRGWKQDEEEEWNV